MGFGHIAMGGALLLLASCASPSRNGVGTADSAKVKSGSGSYLEIDYVRGKNLHRFIATSSSDSVHAECYRDKQLLKARNIDPQKFQDLLKQASDLVNSTLNRPASSESGECRTPFTLKVRNEESIKILDGCRSNDEGIVLGKLIQDAEFLVLSER